MDEKDTRVDLNLFLESYYHLFAIIGVFGALAIYLNRLLDTIPEASLVPLVANELLLKIGIVSSLLLFLYISLLVNHRYVLKISEKIPTDGHKIETFDKIVAPQTIWNLAFLIPFNILVLSVGVASLTFPDATSIVASSVTLLLGVGLSSIYSDSLEKVYDISPIDIQSENEFFLGGALLALLFVWESLPYLFVYILWIRDYVNFAPLTGQGIVGNPLPIVSFIIGWTILNILISFIYLFGVFLSLSDRSTITIELGEE